jgi:hypothetical protein
MQHTINVHPVECQPQWPVRDIEPETCYRDRRIAASLLVLSAGIVVGVAIWVGSVL